MKQKMVTRSVTITKVTLMCVDTVGAEIFNTDVEILGKQKNAEKLLNRCKELLESDSSTKVVEIVRLTEEKRLYGMPETDFVKQARLLPPRGEKAETETENTEQEG